MEIKNYNNDIPDDYYEVMSILQDRNGTLITLDGINNEVKIRFGAVDCICDTDEGSRMETYLNGKTKELNEYSKENRNIIKAQKIKDMENEYNYFILLDDDHKILKEAQKLLDGNINVFHISSALV